MSDITMFDTVIEPHTLQVLATKWDGSREQSMRFAEELQKVARIHGADVTKARHRIETDTGNRLDLAIMRKSDAVEWSVRLRPGFWLAIWLHQHAFSHVEVMAADRGDILFRPVNPIVVLRPRHGEIAGTE